MIFIKKLPSFMLWNNHLAHLSPKYLNLIMIEDLDAMDESFFLEFKELILGQTVGGPFLNTFGLWKEIREGVTAQA
jgi:hypothetical protein